MAKRRPGARPRPRLDLEMLVGAAIALLDEGGLDAITTRTLAARLGVRSPALYWYIRDKNELLDLVADAICEPALEPTLALVDDPGLSRRERWAGSLRLYRAVLRSHRDAPRLLAERPPTGPVRRRLADAAVGYVLEAGFPEADAALISVLLSSYVISLVSEELRFEALAQQPMPGGGQSDPAPSEAAFPNLDRIARQLSEIRPGSIFETGIEILFDGVERRLELLQKPEALPE